MDRIPASARLLSESEASEIMLADRFELMDLGQRTKFVREYLITRTQQRLFVDANTRPPQHWVTDPPIKKTPVDQLPLI